MTAKIVVAGGGISGLAAAYHISRLAKEKMSGTEVVLLEKEDRPGGKIRSEHADGFLFEWGPNGFLDSKPDTLALAREIGFEDRLLPSSDAARKRFIYARSRLYKLPESPPAFFTSGLLSIPGRLRIIKELWAPRTPPGLDTTLAEFARRRLGSEALDKLLDPMVSGVFAGDPSVMSLESSFPRIAELERDHGSLIRAMIGLQREKKRRARLEGAAGKGAEKSSGPAGPGGVLTSFKGGAGELVRKLVEEMSGRVRLGSEVIRLERVDAGPDRPPRYGIDYADASGALERIEADAVLLAIPAYDSASLLRPLDPDASALLDEIPYSAVTVAGLGFDRRDVAHPLDGFGFLAPHSEGRRILGALWTSSIFPGRAPDGKVLLRVMVGGARNPERAMMEDEELVRVVREELGEILGIRAEPAFVRIARWEKAIPQYPVGHGRRLEAIAERLKTLPGIFLGGNAYRGIGMNDCTREALAVAKEVWGYVDQLF